MAVYRFLLGSLLRAGQPDELIAEVPFQSASYTHVLNGPGSFEGVLALQQPAKLHQVLATGMVEGGNSLYVERDGVIVWGGILWTIEDSIAEGTRTCRGEGWHSYFRRRVLRERKVYAQVEQVTIATDLLDYAQSHVGGDLGIVTSSATATGVLRDRTYEAYERVWIGESIEQLAAVQGGFDWRYESRPRAGDVIETRFLTSYPSTGRPTDLVFDAGTQVEQMTITRDATTLCTHADVIGAGEGDASLIVTVASADLIGVIPLLDDVESHTDISVAATLEAHGRRRLARGRAPVVIPSVQVTPADPPLGSYLPGDIVRVRGGVGLAAIDLASRIVDYKVSVDADGAEKVELSFANLEVFTA